MYPDDCSTLMGIISFQLYFNLIGVTAATRIMLTDFKKLAEFRQWCRNPVAVSDISLAPSQVERDFAF